MGPCPSLNYGLEPLRELVDELWEPNLTGSLEAFSGKDRLDRGDAFLNVVINDNVIVFGPVAHLVAGAAHALADHLVGILRARMQALFEVGRRGRQDENAVLLNHRSIAVSRRPGSPLHCVFCRAKSKREDVVMVCVCDTRVRVCRCVAVSVLSLA